MISVSMWTFMFVFASPPEPTSDAHHMDIQQMSMDDDREELRTLIMEHYEDGAPGGLLAAIDGFGEVRTIQTVNSAFNQVYEQTGDWGYLEFGLRVFGLYVTGLPPDAVEMREAATLAIGDIRTRIESQAEVVAFMKIVEKAAEEYENGDYTAAIEQWRSALESCTDTPRWDNYRMQVTSLLASAYMDRYYAESNATDLYMAQELYLAYRESLEPSDTVAIAHVDSVLWEISNFLAAANALQDREVRRVEARKNTFIIGTVAGGEIVNGRDALEHMGYIGHAHRYRQYTEQIAVGAILGSILAVGGALTLSLGREHRINDVYGASLLVGGGLGAILSVSGALLRQRRIDIDALVREHNENVTPKKRVRADGELSVVPTLVPGGASLVVTASF